MSEERVPVCAHCNSICSDPQRVHSRRLLQLHAPEAHLQRAEAGAVWAPAQEVSPLAL
jgi:hypothetical protein